MDRECLNKQYFRLIFFRLRWRLITFFESYRLGEENPSLLKGPGRVRAREAKRGEARRGETRRSEAKRRKRRWIQERSQVIDCRWPLICEYPRTAAPTLATSLSPLLSLFLSLSVSSSHLLSSPPFLLLLSSTSSSRSSLPSATFKIRRLSAICLNSARESKKGIFYSPVSVNRQLIRLLSIFIARPWLSSLIIFTNLGK